MQMKPVNILITKGILSKNDDNDDDNINEDDEDDGETISIMDFKIL